MRINNRAMRGKKLQESFKVCLDAKQQVQANSCRSMWPGNLTVGSSIWSPQHRPPQINSLHRIQKGREEELGRWGGGEEGRGSCMWMVRTSTLRKSEVGSFLRLCRGLTLAETPSLFSLFVFLLLFLLSQSAANFLRVKEGETWQPLYKPRPRAHQQAFMFSYSGVHF